MKPYLKLLAVLLLGFVAGLGTGCATAGGNEGALVQRIFDRTLPHDFTGDVAAHHTNAYFGIDFAAGNVKRTESGWTYDWVVWRRRGFVSGGWVQLGKPPAEAITAFNPLAPPTL